MSELKTTGDAKAKLTKDVVLDAAFTIIFEDGLTGFRLKRLAAELGMTIPNLYRYFDDRTHLIYEACAYGFAKQSRANIDILRNLAAEEPTVDEAWRVFEILYHGALSPFTARSRKVRFQSMAILSEYPMMRPWLEAEMVQLHQASRELLSTFERRGLLATGVTSDAAAILFRSMLNGMIILDLGPADAHVDVELLTVLRRMFFSLFKEL